MDAIPAKVLPPWYRRPAARVLLGTGVTAAAVTAVGGAVLAWMEGAESAGRRVTALSPGWLALGLVVWSGSAYIQGLRWRALLPTQRRPPGRTFGWIVLGANATQLALPGPVGELAAAWYLRHRHGVPMATALAATLLGRAMAILVFGVATLVLWPIRAAALPPELVTLVTPVAVVTGLVTLPIVGLCYRPALVVEGVGKLLAAVLRGERAERVAERVAWWVRCFAAVGHIPARRWAVAAAMCVVNLSILSASTVCTLAAAGIPADPLGIVFMQAFSGVASVAGVLVPGGLGAIEALVIALFPTFAEGSTADAVFVALILRWVHMGALLLGLPAMTWLLATLPDTPERVAPLLAEGLEEGLEEGVG